MPRIAQLDGLRAIAVMLVLVSHTLHESALYALGQTGVRLFFVLSGYLITRILFEQQGQPLGPTLQTFYIRRSLRIFPLYYLALLVCCFVAWPALQRTWPWMITYTSNIQLLVDPDIRQGALSHFWSLAVEEQFYLIWPMLMLAVPHRHTLKVILGAVYLAVLVRAFNTWLQWHSVWFQTPAQFDSLGMGALLAYLHHRQLPMRSDLGVLLKLLVLTLLMKAIPLPAFECVTEAMFHAALVDYSMNPRHIQWIALLRTRPFQFVGTLSYGIYVWHGILAHQPFVGSFGVQKWLLVTISSIGAAWCSWTLIEKPINDLRLRFHYSSGS